MNEQSLEGGKNLMENTQKCISNRINDGRKYLNKKVENVKSCKEVINCFHGENFLSNLSQDGPNENFFSTSGRKKQTNTRKKLMYSLLLLKNLVS